MPPGPPLTIQSPKGKRRTRGSHTPDAPGPPPGRQRGAWRLTVPYSAEPESTLTPPCNGASAGSYPHPTTDRVSPAASGSPLQAPSVAVFVLLLGPVTPPQATVLREGPRTPVPGLLTAGHLCAAADRTWAQHQRGGQWAPQPQSPLAPISGCVRSPSEHSVRALQGPSRDQQKQLHRWASPAALTPATRGAHLHRQPTWVSLGPLF
ncbi:hypothetical protein NDU88_007745 [Pleurodeles waltl]|uniref:Uncharacterized protein n=1 Tax=Pleurodeles waltl TaxID=8319 RepID=A0AAV7N2X7_PLEWA|nr:hypothetical protein NDU88_007745 [Pleurodeles waltl]